MIISVDTFERVQNHNFIIIGFWLIVEGWLIKKDLDSGSSALIFTKYSRKILPVTTSISLLSFVTKWYTIQKIYLKMYSTSCVTVSTLKVEGMVWNLKDSIYQEQKMFFSVRSNNS